MTLLGILESNILNRYLLFYWFWNFLENIQNSAELETKTNKTFTITLSFKIVISEEDCSVLHKVQLLRQIFEDVDKLSISIGRQSKWGKAIKVLFGVLKDLIILLAFKCYVLGYNNIFLFFIHFIIYRPLTRYRQN